MQLKSYEGDTCQVRNSTMLIPAERKSRTRASSSPSAAKTSLRGLVAPAGTTARTGSEIAEIPEPVHRSMSNGASFLISASV